MHTQRVHMLVGMLQEIKTGCWIPTKPIVFDMNIGDWQDELDGVLYGDLIGCAIHDPRIAEEGLTFSRSFNTAYGSAEGWDALCKFFEADEETLEQLFLPESYKDPTLDAVLEKVQSYCHFWVHRTPVEGFECTLYGPTMRAGRFYRVEQAEWAAQELNNAMAFALGQDDAEAKKIWELP